MAPDTIAEAVIPLSKSKVTLLLFLAFAFVAGSAWMWSVADTQIRFNPLYVKCVALAGASFFGLCGVYGCVKVFDGKPGLIVDNVGIVDNSSGISAGRISWEEIVGVRISVIAGQRFVTIQVIDPQKYVERGGVFKRMLNAANNQMVGSPINISSASLRIEFDELVSLLAGSFDKYNELGPTRRCT